MNIQEGMRLKKGLSAAGWTKKEIDDFITYIETGDESLKPKRKPKAKDKDKK